MIIIFTCTRYTCTCTRYTCTGTRYMCTHVHVKSIHVQVHVQGTCTCVHIWYTNNTRYTCTCTVKGYTCTGSMYMCTHVHIQGMHVQGLHMYMYKVYICTCTYKSVLFTKQGSRALLPAIFPNALLCANFKNQLNH